MPRKFKLQNGLDATIHRLQAPALRKIFSLCTSACPAINRYKRRYHGVVAVQIDEEMVWLVFYAETPEETVTHELKTDMKNALDQVYLAVYRDKLYEVNLEVILDSIKNKTPPSITVVLKPPA